MAAFESDDQESLRETVRKLPSDLQRLVEKRLQLFALTVSDAISDAMTRILFTVMAFLIFGVVLLLVVFAVSFYLGALFNDLPLGFLVTAMPLLLIGVLLVLRKPDRVYMNTRRHILDNLYRWVSQKDHQTPTP
jgi:hypothetical protein